MSDYYESQKSLYEYLLFHYGSAKETVLCNICPAEATDFPKRCADLCIEFATNVTRQDGNSNTLRAADIGCAVGRSTFEMTSYFNEVVGIDYSQSFVDTCNKLKNEQTYKYKAILEGELCQDLDVTFNSSWVPERAKFEKGDACALHSDLGQFDCVLAANLICRLHDPAKFFNSLPHLVRSNGILVITSPYTFLTEYTPKENWFGGYVDSEGHQVTGFDGLQRHLGKHFECIAQKEMPFLLRETRRKHQLTVAHATVWKRNSKPA